MLEAWVIALNVFRQLLRNRILVVLSLCALGMVGVVAFLGDLGQDAELRLGRDFGLLALETIGFFTVVLCHAVLLFEEVELKTYAILLVKPIHRWQLLVGRVLGAVLLVLMNQAAMVLLLKALGLWRGLPLVDTEFLIQAAFLTLGAPLLSALTAFFGVIASSVPAAVMFTVFTYGLGHFTVNLLEWVQRIESPVTQAFVKLLYWVTPNFSLFNLRESLGRTDAVLNTGTQLYWPLAYMALYTGALLCAALWAYERKDF